MATFKFGRAIDLHWNGYDIQGPAETVFSIPDQLYEEFDADIAPVEPTLVWIDTNEFLTLTNTVSTATLSASLPIALTTTTSGKTISLSSTTALNGYLLAADGTGGTIWTPASTSSLTSVIGVSPISAAISGGTVSVSIDQSAITGATSATNTEVLRSYVKNASGSTITKGSVVYITGADGTNALIGLSSASTEATSSKTLGILASTLTNNAFGYVIKDGQISNIDTSAASAGSSVWLGNTPGSYVFNAPPAEPSHSVYLGVVTKANVSTGEIVVKVQNGYELDELHDVFVGGVSTALPLVYSSTSSGWVAQELTSVGIADNAIVAAKIAAGAVGTAALATGAVTSIKIAAGAVDTAALGTGAVISAKIAAGAVDTSALGTAAVISAKIAASAVTSGHIAAGAVGSAAIATGSINSTHLATASVGASQIIDASIASAELADNAVVAAKINAAAVNTAKIDSTGGSSGWVLTANGTGGATFSVAAGGGIIAVTTITASTTIALTDKDDLLYVNSASNLVITVPPNSTAAFNIGDQVHLLRAGTGTLTVAAGTGVTVQRTYGLTLRAQWSSASLIKTATNTWILVGDIA